MQGRARGYSAEVLGFEPHPLLHPAAFTATFPASLDQCNGAPLQALLTLETEAPVARSEEVRKAVRDVLRHGGHKPTGRGKPSSEYLVRAAGEGALGSINPAVDAGNGVSLASGVPISVVDLDRTVGGLRVAVPEDGSYVFNPSGQEISVKGLVCLWDQEGPCANAVKDAQRTKTDGGTTRTLSVLWGPNEFADHVEATLTWYRAILEGLGVTTERVG